MAQCITCGSELHPDRAKKYNYCMKPECQRKNLKSLPMVAIGVNKSAEQYLLLDEQTQNELASGKFADQRRGSFGTSVPTSTASEASPGQAVPGQAGTATAARPARPEPAQPQPGRPQPERRRPAPPRPAVTRAPRNPWTKSHLTPSITGSPHKWETWLDSALHNGVPEFGLAKSIKTLSMTAMLPLGQVKFAWNRLKMLECISHAVRQPPIPDA